MKLARSSRLTHSVNIPRAENEEENAVAETKKRESGVRERQTDRMQSFHTWFFFLVCAVESSLA